MEKLSGTILSDNEISRSSFLPGMNPGRDIIILVAVMLALLLPFIGKAFHIDDPLFIWTAQHIVQHPADPYGFSVNWFGTESPVSEVMRNPPLSCYFLALVGLIFGWTEPVLHAAFLVPAITCAIGVYYLARSLCGEPLLASLLSLITPVFLTSATTIMCDVMMIAFWVWALVLWIDGIDRKIKRKLWYASLCMTGCVLTKYNGLAIIPLIALYTLVRLRSARMWWKYMMVPLLIFTLYLSFLVNLYGSDVVWGMANLAMGRSGDIAHQSVSQVILSLTFLGGCFITVLFMIPLVGPWRTHVAALIIVVGAFLLLHSTTIFYGLAFSKYLVRSTAVAFQFSLFIVAGGLILILAVRDARSHRDAGSALILGTLAGILLCAAFASWSVSGRYLLPIVPVFGILLVRNVRNSFVGKIFYRSSARMIVLAAAAAVSLVVSCADYSLANADRTIALEIGTKYSRPDRTLHFQGHWGFQYYLESSGAKALDGAHPQLFAGDVLAIPVNNTNTFPMNPQWVQRIGTIEQPSLSWFTTMSREVGAGFYAHVVGPLPFVSAEISSEKCYIFSIVNPSR